MANERKLTVKILSDASGMKKGIGDAEHAVGGLGGAVGKVGGVIAGAFAVTKIAEFAGDTIKAASNLNEEMSKSEVVFGDAAKAVQEFAKGASKSLGQSELAALQAASNFAVFGKAADLTGPPLVKFSTDMVRLAGDMASFSNTTPEEAIEAIGSALRGEAEPIRKYGVLLNDASLKQRAMTLGIYSGSGALTAQQKVLAAQAEILGQTGDAQGDFTRTSGGLANQQRIMAAEMENLKVTIGEKLLPVVLKFTKALVSLFEKMESAGRGFNNIEDGAIKAGHAVTDLVGRGDATTLMWGRFGKNQMAAADGMENLQKVTKTLTGFMDDLTESTLDLTVSDQAYLENSAGMRKAFDDQREAADKAADAIARLQEATKHLMNEQLGLEGATYAALDSIDAYTEKVKAGDSSLREIAQASISVQQNFGSLAAKAVEAAAAQAELHGATLSTKGAFDAQVGALQELFKSLASDSPLRKALDEYILSLYNIPGEIRTNVDITGRDWDIYKGREGNTGVGGGGGLNPSAVVGAIKTYEQGNGTGWRS